MAGLMSPRLPLPLPKEPGWDYGGILPFRTSQDIDMDAMSSGPPDIEWTVPGLLRDLVNAPVKLNQGLVGQRSMTPGEVFTETLNILPTASAASRAGGTPGGATFGVFAGPRSRTADRRSQRDAENMEKNGVRMDDIRRETGWFRDDVDGMWKYEVSDLMSSIIPSVPGSALKGGSPEVPGTVRKGTLEEILDHHALYEAYPHLSKVPVTVNYESVLGERGAKVRHREGGRGDSTYDRGLEKLDTEIGDIERMIRDPGTSVKHRAELDDLLKDSLEKKARLEDLRDMLLPFAEITTWTSTEDDLRSQLLHEIQHIIQFKENFARGGNPDASVALYDDALSRQLARLPVDKIGKRDEALRDLGKLESVHRIIANENIKKPRMLYGQNDWYEYSHEIRRQLGPEPKRHVDGGRARKEWIKKAGEWLARKEMDDAIYRHGDEIKSIYLSYVAIDPKHLRNAMKRAQYKWSKLNTDEVRKAAALTGEQYNLRNAILDGSITYSTKMDYYRRLGGEVESRNVQDRRNMTQRERRESSPLRSRDREHSDIINTAPDRAYPGLLGKQELVPARPDLFGNYRGGVI